MKKLSISDLKGSSPKELRKYHAMEIAPLLKISVNETKDAYKRLRTKGETVTPIEYFTLADHLMNWYEKNNHLTREAAARKLKISHDRFKRLSQASKWPLKPRLYVVLNSEKFSQTDLESFVRSSWMKSRPQKGKNGKKLKAKERYFDDRSLMASLKRHVDGKKLDIRKHKNKLSEKSADAMRIEDILRQRLMVHTEVNDNGTITLGCGDLSQAYRIKDVICT